MPKTSDEYAEILTKHGIPVIAGVILDAAYKMRDNDWYAKTEAGWFWWDARKTEQRWKACRGPQ